MISLFLSIGRWHGEPGLWREVLGVRLPDGRVVYAKNYGRTFTQRGVTASLAELEVIVPEQRLRFTFDGPVRESTADQLLTTGMLEGRTKRCTIDLLFDASCPLWNMKGDSAGAAAMAGTLHIEQLGRINGTIRYDGQEFHLQDAFGSRDHSRGARDVSRYKRHCWVNGTLGDNLAFHLYAMELRDASGVSMQNAVLIQDGRLIPAKLLSGSFISSLEDRRESCSFLIGSELGELTIRVTEVLATIPLGMATPYDVSLGRIHDADSALVLDEFARFECNGKEGAGWLERGFRLPESKDQKARV